MAVLTAHRFTVSAPTTRTFNGVFDEEVQAGWGIPVVVRQQQIEPIRVVPALRVLAGHRDVLARGIGRGHAFSRGGFNIRGRHGDGERAAAGVSAAIDRAASVENQVHWVLDAQFGEDQSRARAGHAAENLATLRRLALNLLRRDKTKKRGIRGKQLNAGWDHQYLLRLLSF